MKLCTICARGGSKGVPGKNIRPLLGKPLIAHSIEQARASGLFDMVAVSSNSAAILAVAKEYGADITIERPAELASDTAGKLPAIAHAVQQSEALSGKRFSLVVDLDATSPLRLTEDIQGAVKLQQMTGAKSVITGAEAHRSPYFNLVEMDARGVVQVSKPSSIVRRQDSPACYDMNASIYVWQRDVLLADPKVFYDDTRLYEMPRERSQDIDAELDFAIVELILSPTGTIMDYKNMFDLSGRTAMVTGGAGILGARFCAALAAFGANVVVVDRMAETAEKLAATLPGKPCAYALDITDENAVAQLTAQVMKQYGRIDILHNNAATKPANLQRFFDPVEQFDMAVWQEVMRVNLDAMFLVAKHVGGAMAQQTGGGSIIQTASIYGILAPDQRIYEGSEYMGGPINTPAVYSASKAGVVGLTKYLASYWGVKNVRVNSLTPGGVESGQNDIFKQKYGARVPLGRMAHGDEMTGALIYLASDASSYVTGQNLVVDGGLSVW